MVGIEAPKQILDGQVDNQNPFELQNAKFGNIVNLVTKHEEKMAFISQNNDVLLTKLGVIENKMENCEETVESWKEDFDTQDQFEIINNEINEIKKLPLVHMIDHMSNLENKLKRKGSGLSKTLII